MRQYNLGFISDNDIFQHVKNTVEQYRIAIDLEEFNQNLVDPIKLTFDSKVYGKSLEDIIESEAIRQIDKSNTNQIGYFHQKLFNYARRGWIVPSTGFDVINEDKHIFVELKNKHNTMNSASSQKTYMKMQNKLLHEKDCACFLVETIAKKSQNIIWKVTVDKNKMACDYIRRVSMDKFYELVTGEKDAFYKICLVLPECIQQIVDEEKYRLVPKDTVFEELQALAQKNNINDENFAMIMALYMLGFSTYNGFHK